jgi:hypothetical protein
MSFRKVCFFGLMVVLGSGVSARAQVGIYGMYTGTEMSGVQCLVIAPCSSPNGDVKPWGGFGGVYYDFRNVGPVRLGVDVRAGGLHSNRSAADSGGGKDIVTAETFLAGIRGSVKTKINWLSPYAQISAGYTRSNVTEPDCVTTAGAILQCSGSVTTPTPRQLDGFVAFEGFVGADIHVFPFMDVRPIELGIGNMNRMGTGNGSTSVGLKSIGAGVVIRLGH